MKLLILCKNGREEKLAARESMNHGVLARVNDRSNTVQLTDGSSIYFASVTREADLQALRGLRFDFVMESPAFDMHVRRQADHTRFRLREAVEIMKKEVLR